MDIQIQRVTQPLSRRHITCSFDLSPSHLHNPCWHSLSQPSSCDHVRPYECFVKVGVLQNHTTRYKISNRPLPHFKTSQNQCQCTCHCYSIRLDFSEAPQKTTWHHQDSVAHVRPVSGNCGHLQLAATLKRGVLEQSGRDLLYFHVESPSSIISASYLVVGVKDCEGGVENGWKGPTLALSRGCTWNSIPHEAADFTVTIIFYHNINICVYYIHVYIYMHACMCIYICMHVCVYIYICAHIMHIIITSMYLYI